MSILSTDGEFITLKADFGRWFLKFINSDIGTDKIYAITVKFNRILYTHTITFNRFFLPEILSIFQHMSGRIVTHKLNVPNIIAARDELEKFAESNIGKENQLDLDAIAQHMSFKILSHQMPIFQNYPKVKATTGSRGMLLYMATGTGKTFTSLGLTTALHSDTVVIIAPLAIVNNVWIKEVSETLFKTKQNPYIIGSDVPYAEEKYIICSYERINSLPTKLRGKVAVIIDESHNFADSKSKRTGELLEYITNVDPSDVFLLSGTPVKANVHELTTIMGLLHKQFDLKTAKNFVKFYKTRTGLVNKMLLDRFNGSMTYVPKTKLKLKDPIVTYVPMEVPNIGRYYLSNIKTRLIKYVTDRMEYYKNNKERFDRTYRELLELSFSKSGMKLSELAKYNKKIEEIIKAYRQGNLYPVIAIMAECNQFEKQLMAYMDSAEKILFKEAKTVYKYSALKVQGEALANIVMRARIECHRDMAESFEYKDVVDSVVGKTIVFSNYIEVCDAAERRLKEEYYRPVGVYGETVKDLTNQVNKFKQDVDANPLVATYKSLGTGVHLTVANCVIAIDLPFRMYMYDQAIARVWRLGQEHDVYVYIPQLDTGDKPNINSRGIDIIKYFKNEVTKITGIDAEISLEPNEALTEAMVEMNSESISIPETKLSRTSFDEW